VSIAGQSSVGEAAQRAQRAFNRFGGKINQAPDAQRTRCPKTPQTKHLIKALKTRRGKELST